MIEQGTVGSLIQYLSLYQISEGSGEFTMHCLMLPGSLVAVAWTGGQVTLAEEPILIQAGFVWERLSALQHW